MYQKGRRGSLNYARATDSCTPPQDASPWSCPDTKVSLLRVSPQLILPPPQSLPKLTLKPRLSMKKLAAMDEVCRDNSQQCETMKRSSTSFLEKAPNSMVCEVHKSPWKGTEEALDSLAAHIKPRRSRMSFCVSSTIGQEPVTPKETKEPKWFELIPWEDRLKKEAKAPSPSFYINLPQLPFGSHKSYNDVKDIRRLIVSKKEKARRRRKVTKEIKMKGHFAKYRAPQTPQRLSQVPTDLSTQVSTFRDENSSAAGCTTTTLFPNPDRILHSRAASRNSFSMTNLLRRKDCLPTPPPGAKGAVPNTNVSSAEFARVHNLGQNALSKKPRIRLSPDALFLLLTGNTRINFCSQPSKSKPPQVHPKTVPKLFINLRKLPFGVHRSYNDEKEIRSLLVTKRWKAWKRDWKTRLRWSYDDYCASFF